VSAEPLYRSPEQIAIRVGLSRKAIYRAIERGELVAHRLCGRLRIHPDDEHAWIQEHRVTPAPAAELEPASPRPGPHSHSLRRLLDNQQRGPGLVADKPHNATTDSRRNAPAALSTPRGRHLEEPSMHHQVCQAQPPDEPEQTP
jgi:excisionase family DNA binding protein